MPEKKKIIIADIQFLVIEALKCLFTNSSYEISAVVSSSYELEKTLEQQRADLIITDIHQIDYTNIEEIGQIKKRFPETTILVLDNQLSSNEIAGLNKAGIKNLVLKTAEKDEIMNGIEAAIKGKKYYCSEILDAILEMQEKKSTVETHQLTNSEIEIVRLMAEGLTTKEIAERKNLSFHTVMTHRKNIFRKSGVNNASELLMYAMRKGLFDLEYYI